MRLQFLLQGLIEKKVGKLDKYFGKGANCKVVCKKEGNMFKLEINISSKNSFFRSEVIGENMYNNLDIALPKLEKQIIKFKEKKQDLKLSDVVSNLLYLDEFKEDEVNSKISKRKSFNLDPITEDDVYVFLNAETGKVNILYRRKNGEYGLIEVNK